VSNQEKFKLIVTTSKVLDANGEWYDAFAPPVRKEITAVEQIPSVWDLDDQVEWLVENMFPLRSVNLLTAESGTGKTWVSYALAGAVAHGTAFIGLNTVHLPVLYLDGENPLAIAKRNLEELGIGRTADLTVWGGWNDSPPPGPDSPIVKSFAAQHHGLLIWDSLVEFHSGDEQSSTETREFMKHFRRLAHLGATVLILHHTGKSGTSKQYRGSTDIKAAVDTAYFLEGHPTDNRLHRLELQNFKSRFAPGMDFGMEFISKRGFAGSGLSKRKPDGNQILTEILTDHPGSNATEVVALAKGKLGRNKVNELLAGGPWDRKPGKGNSTLYYVSEPVDTLAEPVEERADIPISLPLEKGQEGNTCETPS
jgi:hypothetical protein